MPPSEQQSGNSTPRFTSQTTSAEDLLKSQTVGLVHLSDFRKRRAEVLEQKEREAHDKSLGRFTSGNSRSATPSTGDVTDSEGPPKKKKKKQLMKSKLSFGDDEENDTGDEPVATPRETSVPRSASRTPADDSSAPSSRRITPNPNAPPPPKALTKAALKAEAEARDALRREFLAMQEAVKNTEILIPFIFYDGTNIPAGAVKVRKGDPVWLFLDRCRKVGAELGVAGASGAAKGRKDNRREWARISVDDLMLVRGEIIVPHHYEFYYFIANQVPSFSSAGGLLFDYSNKPPPAASSDNPLSRPDNDHLEGADKDATLTKVVDRRWYERNKHIFPASLWREYEPGPETMDIKLLRHIFCLPCADTLGLSHPTHGERRCPACQTILVNPDDAASTVLNPSEDYKTSVLSGLDPNTIMECASRALVFWAYQATQEIFYQEYLGKSLTEKYSTLNTHMDRVIHNANTEISALQAKLNSMQATEEQLRKKNQELVNLYREKCKKFAQITNLYNILKSRAMRSQMRTAASDTVSQTLDSLGNSVNARSVSGLSRPMGVSQPPQTPASHQGNPRPVNLEGVEQLHRHQRSGTGSSKSTKQKVDAAVMPPPTVPVNLRNRSIPNATPQQRTRLPGPPIYPELPHHGYTRALTPQNL
ncbi:XAP5, circadian clock regulator-domain-containing protein [Aspergillus fumigatus]